MVIILRVVGEGNKDDHRMHHSTKGAGTFRAQTS